MKRVLAFALLALTAVGCSDNEVKVGSRTTMEIDRVYDAGTVALGEVVHASFKVKNTGDQPLVIGDVKVGCSCTLASKPEKPVNPGETAIIEAKIDTQKIGQGKFNKGINVVANTNPSVTMIKIVGEVK